ncbi:DUF885 family protein [Hymenobacter saemangeumensis]|uniref:DUF885 family protein n=1 Tax=Hymenobacter saemangeumensis TaxID=1084522 RepID=A0ABP8HY50_9BACT
MRLLTLAFVGFFLLYGGHARGQKRAAAPAARSAASPQLAALFERYWERSSQLFPLHAMSQGDNRYNDRLPNDQTQAFRDTLRHFYQRSLAQLQKFDRVRLSENDRVSYDIFRYRLQTDLAGLQLNNWMMPFTQFGGLPIMLAQLGAGTGSQPFRNAKDYDNWLARLHGFPAWADSAIVNMRRGLKAGVVLPRAVVSKMIPQLHALLPVEPGKSVFYGPFTTFPKSVAEADRQRLSAALAQALPTDVVAPYQRLIDFLEKEYLPQARASTGLGALPGGAQRYAHAVRYWTTTERKPEEIYQTGLREVARIRGEMERVKQQIGFKGDLTAYFNFVNTDSKFRPFKTEAEVLAAFAAIQQRLAPALPALFSRRPSTGFEVRATEAYRAASASAQYNRGAPDGSRPGIFYVPILDAGKYNIVANPAMEALFLHEAIPGHHYQVSLQQENASLPKFRRFGSYSAMSEGWALYCESLGSELGLYTDPYQRLGALGTEIHRAIRLVVDVGMHARGMTREEAIKYMMDNEAISEQSATTEIERYMAIPGQALSYKIGELKIQELRSRYQKQLGRNFSLRAFHDELLKDGAMPLAVLERKMDRWAARQAGPKK